MNVYAIIVNIIADKKLRNSGAVSAAKIEKSYGVLAKFHIMVNLLKNES